MRVALAPSLILSMKRNPWKTLLRFRKVILSFWKVITSSPQSSILPPPMLRFVLAPPHLRSLLRLLNRLLMLPERPYLIESLPGFLSLSLCSPRSCLTCFRNIVHGIMLLSSLLTPNPHSARSTHYPLPNRKSLMPFWRKTLLPDAFALPNPLWPLRSSLSRRRMVPFALSRITEHSTPLR